MKVKKRIFIIVFILASIIICGLLKSIIGDQYCIDGKRSDNIDRNAQTLGNHYVYSTDGSSIYIKNVDSGKVYAVATDRGFLKGYSEPFFSGEYIYYFDNWDGQLSTTLFRSSITDNNTNKEIVMDWVLYPVTVGDNILYYCEKTKIKAKDLNTKTEKEIFDMGDIDESTELSLFKYINDDLYLAYENKLVYVDLSSQKSKVLCSMKDKDEYFIDLVLLENEEVVFLTNRGLYSYTEVNGVNELLYMCIDEIEVSYPYSDKKLHIKENLIYFNDSAHNLHCYNMKTEKDEIVYKLRGGEDIVSAEYHFCDDYIIVEWYQYNTYENVERKEMKFKYN